MNEARQLLEKDKVLELTREDDATYFSVAEDERVGLDYAKNTAIHFFVPDAILATALLTSPSPRIDEIQARTLGLSRLFKQEFIYRSEPFPVLFERRLARLEEQGLVIRTDECLTPTALGARPLRLLAGILLNFVEAYVLASDALHLLVEGPRERREFIRTALARGRAAYQDGAVRRRESLSKATLESAIDLFEAEQIVERCGEKGRSLQLGPACGGAANIDARTAAIRAFLLPPEEG